MTLGLWGMWSGRRHWREHLVFYALFVSFAVITALFWGHTSHRAYLDVYWIVFAAGALQQLQSRYFTRTTRMRLQQFFLLSLASRLEQVHNVRGAVATRWICVVWGLEKTLERRGHYLKGGMENDKEKPRE